MPGPSLLHACVALLVAGALLLLLGAPLCASEACPMGENAARSGCDPLEGDCCQTQGEQVVSSVQVLSLALLVSPTGSDAPAGTERTLSEPFSHELALPAILQGVGLHTLFAVFLI